MESKDAYKSSRVMKGLFLSALLASPLCQPGCSDVRYSFNGHEKDRTCAEKVERYTAGSDLEHQFV